MIGRPTPPTSYPLSDTFCARSAVGIFWTPLGLTLGVTTRLTAPRPASIIARWVTHSLRQLRTSLADRSAIAVVSSGY